MYRIVPTLTIAAAFVALLAVLAAGAGAGGSPVLGGIKGRVVSSPTCPVERMPPDPACAPRGFKARVRIYGAADNRTVALLVTRSDGRFHADLQPERYRIRAHPTSGKLPRCPSYVKVTVHGDRVARVTINCDSGIR